MTVRAYLLAAVFVGSVGGVLADDWPQWRGPNRDGKSTETGLLRDWPKGGPKLAWKLDDVGTGYGQPAVVGDRVYVVGAEGKKADAREFVRCLSAADGKEVWKVPVHTTPVPFLDLWGGGPRATPTVSGGVVYVLGASGNLVALTADTGKQVWAKNLVTDFGGEVPKWGYSESPLVDGDKVIVTPGGKDRPDQTAKFEGGVIALNKDTGALVWGCKGLTDPAGYASAVVAEVNGKRMYVTQTMKSGVGVDADRGTLLWQTTGIKRATAVIPTPVVKGDVVFFTSGYDAGSECYKIEPDGVDGFVPTPIYTHNPVMSNHHGGVVLVGDLLYGHTDRNMKGGVDRSVGTWIAFDFQKDAEDAVWRSDKLGKGSVTYADGYLYCYGQEKGELVRVKADPKGWQEAGRFAIPQTSKQRVGTQGKVWTHPVVAGGRLYLRDYELLYVYDLRPGA
jgi:outer membrane protein assembly factor BamB